MTALVVAMHACNEDGTGAAILCQALDHPASKWIRRSIFRSLLELTDPNANTRASTRSQYKY
eukprot:2749655-Heterocapsa_arctica.AAC.1